VLGVHHHARLCFFFFIMLETLWRGI
jgi:hypothetical protein